MKSPTNWAPFPPAQARTKQGDRISYNGRPPRFDIREWAPGREKMGRGITLSETEAKDLCKILFQYFKNRG